MDKAAGGPKYSLGVVALFRRGTEVNLLRVTPNTNVPSWFISLAVPVFGVAAMVFVLQASGQMRPQPEEKKWRVVVLNNADFLLPSLPRSWIRRCARR